MGRRALWAADDTGRLTIVVLGVAERGKAVRRAEKVEQLALKTLKQAR